jgi:hypothetical protein
VGRQDFLNWLNSRDRAPCIYRHDEVQSAYSRPWQRCFRRRYHLVCMTCGAVVSEPLRLRHSHFRRHAYELLRWFTRGWS